MQIDVCIATFKRPALLQRLLRDLMAQQLPDGVSMHIIVVDNDVLESAQPVVAAFQGSCTSLEYVTQPERNIALARNSALLHSEGEMIAFIDDDESAPTLWLSSLLATMERYAADAVLGPVQRIPPEDTPKWVAQGRFFKPRSLPSGTRIRVGGAGNALLKASAVRGKVVFDPQYGLTGGEDTDFFYRLWRTGAVMVWCQEAVLTESVPRDRLCPRWLLEREFGAGQRYADIVDRPEGGVRFWAWLSKRASLAAGSAILTVVCVPFSRALAMRCALRSASNLGRLSTLLRYRHDLY